VLEVCGLAHMASMMAHEGDAHMFNSLETDHCVGHQLDQCSSASSRVWTDVPQYNSMINSLFSLWEGPSRSGESWKLVRLPPRYPPPLCCSTGTIISIVANDFSIASKDSLLPAASCLLRVLALCGYCTSRPSARPLLFVSNFPCRYHTPMLQLFLIVSELWLVF